MRIFLYEFTCAAADPGLPASLRAEGRAMLAAAAEDFGRVPGVSTCTLLHAGPGSADIGPSQVYRHEGGEEELFRRLARAAEATLVIAPETDDQLRTRCRWVLEEGGQLLGPGPAAVGLTADKLALADHLRRHGVATPPAWPWPLAGAEVPGNEPAFPAVLKPRFGAGSLATFLVRDPAGLAPCAAAARRELGSAEMVLQPYVPGVAASVALLVGPDGPAALLPAEQHLSEDDRFRYRGGRIPLAPPLADRARRLARQAAATVPGLRGYVGVDLVLGEADDGSRDQVIEINPRLTTSYVGLRRLARGNLAGALLRTALGLPPGELSWHPGAVCFRADGAVEEWRPS
jgi:predicted ATP-grasp superfamily ATP-dependent carboligase